MSIIGIFGFSVCQGQDIHLSQFYTAAHLLNPAEVGNFDGDYRISGNYRNQWRQISDPLSTYMLSFDRAFHYYSHEINAGIYVAQDQFTGFNLKTSKILLTGAYGYNYEGHILRGGFQTGLVFRGSDLSKQTFPSQWDYPTGTFNQSIPNQEVNLSPSTTYLDLNIGFNWTKNFGKFKPTVGLALNHFNRPKDTYFQQQFERLRTRKVFHADANYALNSHWNLQPKLLMMWTTKANDLIIGSEIERKIAVNKFKAIHAGIFYRHGVARNIDAIFPTIGATYDQYRIGLSYDINLSSLNSTISNKSSFEVSIIYTGLSSALQYITTPCDRY